MKNRAIISLADSKYFELLNELIDSILSFKESESITICILDAGLEMDQIKILEKKVHKIVKAKWDIEVPQYKIKGSCALVGNLATDQLMRRGCTLSVTIITVVRWLA